MLPFKVYDRETKVTWIILNYHPDGQGGAYLAAREDDSNQDGELRMLSAGDVTKFRMVGFVDEQD